MTIGELRKAGFKFGTYAGSVQVLDGHYYEPSVYINYREGPDKVIPSDATPATGIFSLEFAGNSSLISKPVKIHSLEDIEALSNFFN